MKKILFAIFIIAVFGCKEKPTAEAKPEQSILLSAEIDFEPTRKVTLLPEAEEKVSQWLAYATAQNQIADMKSATGIELVQNSQPLIQIMQALRTSIPDSLKVPAVQARINVLLTKANILHQEATKKNTNPEVIFETANDIITEFDNFKIQLNEVYVKTPEDFEFELDKEFEETSEQDSISSEL